MPNSIISEGKTTEQAIESGLEVLKVARKDVEIKVLEEENKKSFFSILTPRVVKVELTVKEGAKIIEKSKKENNTRSLESREHRSKTEHKSIEKKYNQNTEELEVAKKKIEEFMTDFIAKLNVEDIRSEVSIVDYAINVNITGESIGFLIGYRGDVLESLQTILSAIVSNKDIEKIRVLVDVSGYRQKRVKTLEDLAEKIAKTVIRTGKSITLEPMSSYERKIIHSKIQNHPKIVTHSVGEEPYRKIVVTLK